jgi:hypothetical protein
LGDFFANASGHTGAKLKEPRYFSFDNIVLILTAFVITTFVIIAFYYTSKLIAVFT